MRPMAPRQLPIEFIGGPRDGAKSFLLRATPHTPLRYPIEIQVTSYDVDQHIDTTVGRYVRDASSLDGEYVRYLWTSHVTGGFGSEILLSNDTDKPES
jgi:hypothetical protein